MHPSRVTLVAVLAIAPLLAGCAGGERAASPPPPSGSQPTTTTTADDDDPDDAPTLLFAVSAPAGTITEDEDGGTRLTLEGSPLLVTWFLDAPARLAGSTHPSELVESWDELGFAEVPPKAALQHVMASDDRRSSATAVVELDDPQWDAVQLALSFAVQLVPDPDDHLAPPSLQLADSVPARISGVSLFIDDGDASGGDPIRGDLPIEPASSGWFDADLTVDDDEDDTGASAGGALTELIALGAADDDG